MNKENENHAVSVEFAKASIIKRSEKKSKHEEISMQNEIKTTKNAKFTFLSNPEFGCSRSKSDRCLGKM